MVANINLIQQESYSVVNLEKQLSRTVNDFSHRLKMEGEEQLFHCVNELKYGCRVIMNMTCLKIEKPHCGNAKYQKAQPWQ